MTGESPFSSNYMPNIYGKVGLSEVSDYVSGKNQYQFKLPPLSLTGIKIKLITKYNNISQNNLAIAE